MNILILNGSPRKRGNTDLLLEKIEEGVHRAGQRAEHVNLAHLSIHPCTGCGHCARLCPAGAITIVNKHAVIDRKKCVRCFCCQEFCPSGAMRAQRSFVARLLSK